MLGGCVDPIAFLRYEGDEWDIACVVMEEVIRQEYEEKAAFSKEFAKSIGNSAGKEVARVFANFFR